MMKILPNSLHGLAAIVTIMKKSAIKGEINNDFLQRMIKIPPISPALSLNHCDPNEVSWPILPMMDAGLMRDGHRCTQEWNLW